MPPTTGPMAIDAPADAAQMAMAVLRACFSRNRSEMIARVAGKISAAAAPRAARAVINSASDVACVARNEIAAKHTSPATSVRRRPIRSPR